MKLCYAFKKCCSCYDYFAISLIEDDGKALVIGVIRFRIVCDSYAIFKSRCSNRYDFEQAIYLLVRPMRNII
jgi:hypothetical protein